jgi:DNA-binding ferritin-like protein
MFNMSSAMAGQFSEAAHQMAERIATLGPNPLKQTEAGRVPPEADADAVK